MFRINAPPSWWCPHPPPSRPQLEHAFTWPDFSSEDCKSCILRIQYYYFLQWIAQQEIHLQNVRLLLASRFDLRRQKICFDYVNYATFGPSYFSSDNANYQVYLFRRSKWEQCQTLRTEKAKNPDAALKHDPRQVNLQCQWNACGCPMAEGGVNFSGDWIWKEVIGWLIGMVRRQVVSNVTRREYKAAEDEILLPDLSNLDFTTFAFLFPYAFAHKHYQTDEEGNPTYGSRISRPLHPYLQMQVDQPYDRMLWIEDSSYAPRTFAEAQRMARSAYEQSDSQEAPNPDEYHPLPARTERRFWRWGIYPVPAFPLIPRSSTPNLLPPKRKVAAYGSLTLHVQSLNLSGDPQWLSNAVKLQANPLANDEIEGGQGRIIGPLCPISLTDPTGHLQHMLVIHRLWEWVLKRFSEGFYSLEYLQRARNRGERGLGGIGVHLPLDFEDIDTDPSNPGELDGVDDPIHIPTLQELWSPDRQFWEVDIEDPKGVFMTRWARPGEVEFWTRRIEERMFLLLTCFEDPTNPVITDVHKHEEDDTEDWENFGPDTHVEFGGGGDPGWERKPYKLNIPEQEQPSSKGALKKVAKEFVLVLTEFPELAWQGLGGWYGRDVVAGRASG